MRKTRVVVLGAPLTLATAAIAVAAPGTETGPSSSQSPYLVRSQPGIVTKSILTTGDSVGGYKLVGIPDGLGAYDNGDGSFTLLSNHELVSSEGVPRAHGARGAFVSKWTINKSDLSVVSGQDLIQRVNVWDSGLGTWTAASGDAAPNRLNRLCSADLAPISAYYNAATGKGYNGRIFADGEESTSPAGRPFGHVVDTGQSYELTPWLGTMAFENVVANPATGDKTTVMANDDSTPGQIYMHVGTKTDTGNEVQKAGLANGKLYGVKVAGVPTESAKTDWHVGDSLPITLEDVSAHAAVGGSAAGSLEADSVAAGVTGFQRPEDGSWDPSHPSDYYFVTTSNFGPNSAGTLNGHTRLWRLHFADPANPAAGGQITLLLDGPVGTPDSAGGTQAASSPGPQMFDNITVNDRGQIVMLEDVGNQSYRGGVWVYDIGSGSLTRVAQADPALFTPGSPGFITKDEEASGVIPAPFLGADAYLLDEQVHKASTDPALVEGGQLMELHIPAGILTSRTRDRERDGRGEKPGPSSRGTTRNIPRMRIDEILSGPEPSFSVEFFPPKTDEGRETLFETVRVLRDLEPSYFSVTYGAGGTTREGTVETVRAIRDEYGVESMAHLSCVGETADGLRQVLDRVAEAGIENVLALRGDPPAGEGAFVPHEGGLASAAELAVLISNEYPGIAIGGSCFPEVHPEAESLEADLAYLKTKVAGGASFLITQLFFDNRHYFEFVAAARAAGIEVPIIAGLMPITSYAQIVRFCKLCEATIPEKLAKAMEALDGDERAEFNLGVAWASAQSAELMRGGAPGIHFYALNRYPATRAILSMLRATKPWLRSEGEAAVVSAG